MFRKTAGILAIIWIILPSVHAFGQTVVTPSVESQSLPPELVRFQARYEAVMARKDLNALGDMIAPGFLHNGRDKEGMINNFKSFTPYINAYKMEIVRFMRDGELLVTDYKIVTDMATTEHSVPFKTIDGELYFYGNQRPLNRDGSLGAAPKQK